MLQVVKFKIRKETVFVNDKYIISAFQTVTHTKIVVISMYYTAAFRMCQFVL